MVSSKMARCSVVRSDMEDDGCDGGEGASARTLRARSRGSRGRRKHAKKGGDENQSISGEVFSPGRASRGVAPRACRTYEAWGALGDVGTDSRDGAGTRKQRGRCAGTVSALGKNGAPRAFFRYVTRRALFSREKIRVTGTLSQQTVDNGVEIGVRKRRHGTRSQVQTQAWFERKLFTTRWALSRELRRGLRLDAPPFVRAYRVTFPSSPPRARAV